MQQNQLSRYGAISRIIPELAPGAKVFLVADSDDTSVGAANLANVFPVDNEGVVRVFTTIQSAVNACRGGAGDVVLVAPGSSFAHNRADSWDVADVSVIGMGSGDQRPTISYDTATSLVTLGANGVRTSNIKFLASVDCVAGALVMDSGFSGQKVDKCLFTWDATTNDFVTMIKVGAKHSVIEDNDFLAEDTAGSGRGISLVGGKPDYLTIRRNNFYGQFDTVGDTTNGAAMIAIDTTHDSTDSDLSGLIIDRNVFTSTDTAATAIIRFGGGAIKERGVISNNVAVTYDCALADTTQWLPGLFQCVNNFIKRADTTEKLIADSFAERT